MYPWISWCRLCGCEDDIIDLESSKIPESFQRIAKYLSVQVHKDENDLPGTICNSCYETLSNFDVYASRCEKVQCMFHTVLKNAYAQNSNIDTLRAFKNGYLFSIDLFNPVYDTKKNETLNKIDNFLQTNETVSPKIAATKNQIRKHEVSNRDIIVKEENDLPAEGSNGFDDSDADSCIGNDLLPCSPLVPDKLCETKREKRINQENDEEHSYPISSKIPKLASVHDKTECEADVKYEIDSVDLDNEDDDNENNEGESNNFDDDENLRCILSPTQIPTASSTKLLNASSDSSNQSSNDFTTIQSSSSRLCIKVDVPGNEPIDYFNLLFDDTFYNFVVFRSNKYAKDALMKSKSDRFSLWKDITKKQFRVWLGLLFHMGTIKLPLYSDYWNKHHLFNIQVFSQFMSRSQFSLILQFLYFNENEVGDESLDKIIPLIDFFNNKMAEIYEPNTNKEMDILWRGKLKTQRRTKSMKSKYGVNLHMLGESHGLALKIFVQENSSDAELKGNNHTNNADESIEEKIRLDHFSTMQLNESADEPEMLIEYNKQITNLNYHHQMKTYYPYRNKTFKWHKKVGIHLFHSMLMNAFYLYNINNSIKMSLYNFRLKVIESLLTVNNNTLLHLPEYYNFTSANSRKQRKRCKYCSHVNKKRSDSLFYCPQCPDQAGFCLSPCFRLYHENP